MALNDDLDKLRIAEDYLLEQPAQSQEFEAALEHVRWVYTNQPEYRPRCEAILKNVVTRRCDEEHTMEMLRLL